MSDTHDHELRAAYHRGYVDGQHVKDADRYAAALRLQRLDFDGGSHENLGKIARAVYPCATAWTVDTCRSLRDEIVRLLGGCVGEHENKEQSNGLPDDDGRGRARDAVHPVRDRDDGRVTAELRGAMLPCVDDRWLTIERSAFDAIADRIDAEHQLAKAMADASKSDKYTAMEEYRKVSAERDEILAKLRAICDDGR